MKSNGTGKKVEKQGYFSAHAKSSAAAVSLILHAVLIVAALSFVAVRVHLKEDPTFETREVRRPQLKLRKLQVPVKESRKTQAPKLRQNILAKPKNVSVEIRMPEVVGVPGGTYGSGEGLGGIGFGFDMDLFGSDKGSGNELVGTFYDLKMTPDRAATKMNDKAYKEALAGFLGSWNINRLEDDYFRAPENRFATTFILPKMQAAEAPKAYKVEDVVEPRYWMAYYTGEIMAPKTGRYRFWGGGDDALLVRINKRMVLDGCRQGTIVTDWKSDDPRSGRYMTSGETMKIGDWFNLTEGKPVRMEVLIGERPGGLFSCTLLIEEEGVRYEVGKDGRPLLPVFKTTDVAGKLIEKMKIEHGTFTVDGPSFGILK